MEEVRYQLLRDVVLDPLGYPDRYADHRVVELWTRAYSYSNWPPVDARLMKIIYSVLVEDLEAVIVAYAERAPRHEFRLFESGPWQNSLCRFMEVEYINHEQRFRILEAVSENPSVVSILKASDRKRLEEYHATKRAMFAPFVRRLDELSIARGTPGIAIVILPTDSVDGVLAALEDQSRNPGDFDFGDCKRRRL